MEESPFQKEERAEEMLPAHRQPGLKESPEEVEEGCSRRKSSLENNDLQRVLLGVRWQSLMVELLSQ